MSILIFLIGAAVIAYALGWRPTLALPGQLWALVRGRGPEDTDHPSKLRLPLLGIGAALVAIAFLIAFWPHPPPQVVANHLAGTPTEVYDAVKAYQAAHGLTPDGVLGPNTCAKLYRSCSWQAAR